MNRHVASQRIATVLIALVCLAFAGGPASAKVSKEFNDVMGRAIQLAKAGELDAAQQVLNSRGLQLGLSDEERAHYYNVQAFVHYEKDELQASIDAYEKLLSVPGDPANVLVMTHYTIAQLYMMLDKYDATIDYLHRYFEAQPWPKASEIALYGQAYYKQGDYLAAIPYLKQAIDRSEATGQQSEENWWQLLARSLRELREYDDRADAYDVLIQRWPSELNLLSAINAYFDIADAARAAAAMRTLLAAWPDNENYRPIHLAAAENDNDAIQKLVASGTPVDQKTSQANTALGLAARFGFETVVQALLDLGADVNGTGEPDTPIVVAAAMGHDRIVELMWSAGADPTLHAEDGFGLLPHVARIGNSDLIARLVERHPELLEIGGSAALSSAAKKGNYEAFKLLIELGARPEESPTRSTMFGAAKGGSIQIISRLVDMGADVNSRSDGLYNPLSAAAYYGHADAVGWLLLRGAKINIDPEDGDSALRQAVLGGHAEVVKLLLEAGADVDGEANQDGSPLVNAIVDQQAVIVRILVAAGANVNEPIYRDNDALHVAASVRNPEIVSILLEAGAKPEDDLAKFARWGRSDIRGFLEKQGFERVKGAVEETWSRDATNVVLAGKSRRYDLPELIEIVRQSQLQTSFWINAR